MISLDNLVKNSIMELSPTLNGTANQAQALPILDAKQPFLQGTEPIFEGFQWVSEIFEKIEDQNMKNALKNALADAEIEKIEDAVTREVAFLSMSSNDPERKTIAVKRIEEGMDFWQRRILQKISGATQ